MIDGKEFFKAEDFKVQIGKHTDLFTDKCAIDANNKLSPYYIIPKAEIDGAKTVYLEERNGILSLMESSFSPPNYKATHTAKLICIEEIKKNELKFMGMTITSDIEKAIQDSIKIGTGVMWVAADGSVKYLNPGDIQGALTLSTEKQCLEHEPLNHNGFDVHKCKHCNVPLKPKWEKA